MYADTCRNRLVGKIVQSSRPALKQRYLITGRTENEPPLFLQHCCDLKNIVQLGFNVAAMHHCWEVL